MHDETVSPKLASDDPETFRPLMLSIAYRMLGSMGDAEDVVQEAYLRFHRTLAQGEAIASSRAFLTTITTRLAIDELRSARMKHEAYVGVWLPEPLVATLDPDPEEVAEKRDFLSLAFLALLERLSPVERAVFLLREVFDYGYDEISDIVQKSEENCRQIFTRARKHVDNGRPRFDVNPREQRELARRFFEAADRGDLADLVSFLAADASFYGDGGGKARAYPEPIVGRERVAQIMRSIIKAAHAFNIRYQFALVNGQPGALGFDAEGRVINALAFDLTGEVVSTVRSIVNPDKLTRLGFPVSDLARVDRDAT